MKLEVCVDSLESALNAAQGGASRLEVCSSLSDGGLTPSIGLVVAIKKRIQNIPLYAMVRCRSGSDFIYTESEIIVMLEDIVALNSCGVNGFVFGALTRDGMIDIRTCSQVIKCASPRRVTFHRAFDICSNPFHALETVISLGFERILTSGQQPSVASDSACELIKKLILKASDRIIIMPGAGVAPHNINKILDTGAFEVHGSFKRTINLPSHSLNMGLEKNEIVYVTDRSLVENVAKCIDSYDSKS